MQIEGSIVRIASYHAQEFQEGVSLTIYDEIARWQKWVSSQGGNGAAEEKLTSFQVCLRVQRNDLPSLVSVALQGALHAAVQDFPGLQDVDVLQDRYLLLHLLL